MPFSREQQGPLLSLVLPRHRDPCNCTCVFCDGDSQSSELLSPRYPMQHLLCPPSCQFHLSNVSLYDWDCIFNRCSSYTVWLRFCIMQALLLLFLWHDTSLLQYNYSFRMKRGDLSWICRSWHRMGPHGHLSQMTGRDQDTSHDASHRLARLQKRYWYFLNFSRL